MSKTNSNGLVRHAYEEQMRMNLPRFQKISNMIDMCMSTKTKRTLVRNGLLSEFVFRIDIEKSGLLSELDSCPKMYHVSQMLFTEYMYRYHIQHGQGRSRDWIRVT